MPCGPASLDADVAAHMRTAFAAGNLVVMPTEQSFAGRPSWWRVNPVSGATLGVGPDGRGQMSEQILALMNSIDNASSAVATVQKIWSCILTQPSPGSKQCCIVKTGVDVAANKALGKLARARAAAHEAEAEDVAMKDGVLPVMAEVRAACDALEKEVPADLWPLPTYRDMLFVK